MVDKIKAFVDENFIILNFLLLLQAILRQFSYGLNTCSPEVLLKVGASFPEMSQQEKILDAYIEMLKTDQVRTETFR